MQIVGLPFQGRSAEIERQKISLINSRGICVLNVAPFAHQKLKSCRLVAAIVSKHRNPYREAAYCAFEFAFTSLLSNKPDNESDGTSM
jgi:hypothetical protein